MNGRLDGPYRGSRCFGKEVNFYPLYGIEHHSLVSTPTVLFGLRTLREMLHDEPLYFTKLERWNLKHFDVTCHLLVPTPEDFIGNS
jgi:hypothetical protein